LISNKQSQINRKYSCWNQAKSNKKTKHGKRRRNKKKEGGRKERRMMEGKKEER
jgi:hypothetical protein